MNEATKLQLDPEALLDHLRALCAATAPAIEPVADDPWIRVLGGHPPAQGWKLHVAAWPANAFAVLDAVVPVLLAEKATFKIARSMRDLIALNQGHGGESQMGKFVTVYPDDDDVAVRLAALLDRATAHLSGPAVPSDRPLRPESLVSYRYGGITAGVLVQNPIGMMTPAIEGVDGRLVADVRGTSYVAPDGRIDPFEASGLYEAPPATERVIAGRFAPVATVHRSPRSTVQLAVDIEALRPCVVKRASHRHMPTFDGASARDRLRHEAATLARLTATGVTPEVYAVLELDDETVLAVEDLGSRTLDQDLRHRFGYGGTPEPTEMLDLAVRIAEAVRRLHEAGIAHRDIKAMNIMLGPDGRVRLLDLESSSPLDALVETGGTQGYLPPEIEVGPISGLAHDLWAYGAVLYFIATSAEPASAPIPTNLLAWQPRLLNPTLPPVIGAVLDRCLAPDPAVRFASMSDVLTALRARPPATAAMATTAAPDPVAAEQIRTIANDAVDELMATVVNPGDGTAWWIDADNGPGDVPTRDIGTGSAGQLLALAELAHGLGRAEECAEVIAMVATWLRRQPRPLGEPPVGLHVGDAGVLATLLRVGQLTGDDALIEEAVRRSHEVAALPTPSPDLYNGFAGVARAVALVAAATADPGVVALAARTGDELIRRATVTDDGWCWEFPAGFGSMSVAPQLGYAHGAAGVAGALLDVYELTGEERFAAAADRGLDWLAHQSLPASPGGRGVGWPSQPGGPIHAPAWCHGAGGIGLAFLDAARLGVRADALDIALGAAEYLLARGRVISPCQCHGLAGHLELLLDLHQHTGDARWRTECDEMVTLMRAFRFRRDGLTSWQGEHPGTPALGYMTGGPGIALALLRLLEADRRPRQLTLAGFAYRPALAGADLTACASSAR